MLYNRDTVSVNADDLFRVIGKKTDLMHPEGPEYLGSNAVHSQVACGI